MDGWIKQFCLIFAHANKCSMPVDQQHTLKKATIGRPEPVVCVDYSYIQTKAPMHQ